MSARVVVMPRALRDAQKIFDWLKERSPAGAAVWYEAFAAAVESLAESPERCAVAEESPIRGREIRQLIFRTRRGRPYRLLYTSSAGEVCVLHVRGTGQPPLGPT